MNLNEPLRIVLVSSSKLFLEGICRILNSEEGIKVVAATSHGKDVEKHLCKIKPEFLFLDSRTPNPDVSNLSDLVNKKSPDTKVILFNDTGTEYKLTFSNVIRVNKETSCSELVKIIKGPNKSTINKGIVRKDGTTYRITRMEIRVLELIGRGFRNKEIADRLLMREKTVKAHLSNIFTKLGLQSRYQLIVYRRRLKRRAG